MKNRPDNILMVCGSSAGTPCGVGGYTRNLVNALSSCGQAHVTLLTSALPPSDPSKNEYLPGVKVEATAPHWRLSSLARLCAAARKARPGVVHVQFPARGYGGGALPTLALFVAYCRLVLRVPVVLTLHEHVDTPVLSLSMMAAWSSALVAVRAGFRFRSTRGWGWWVRRKQVTMIGNASNLPRVPRTPELVAQVRERLGAGDRRVVAYFGFLQPSRGVEQLFEVADPGSDVLAILGGRLPEHSGYFDSIAERARSSPWNGSAFVMEMLSDRQAAEYLAAADVVVLPFVDGAGEWSTSIHAAKLQGTPIVSTSRVTRGDFPSENIYYVPPGDRAGLAMGIRLVAGRRNESADDAGWEQIAQKHLKLYADALA